LNPTHFFWVDETGYSHIIPQGSHFTGITSDEDHNSYWAFDLSEVSDPITSATMIWEADYPASTANTTFQLFDFTSVAVDDVSYSTMRNEIGDASIYYDLGTGVSYGVGNTGSGSPNVSIFSVNLNSAGISALNDSLGGKFAFGLTLVGGGDLFSGLDPSQSNHRLVLNAVPEPSSYALLAGLLILGFVGSQRAPRRSHG
jgi:hypothetical protein